jgi:DNA-binding CsgD family transcriptional regulator
MKSDPSDRNAGGAAQGGNDVSRTISDEHARIEHQLRERVKELRCLYGIAQIVERHGTSIDHLLQGTVDLLPPAWQFPQNTCARIRFDEKRTESPGFQETRYRQSADIVVLGKKSGTVEVFYTRKMPRSDEGPFLKEERALIDAVAERLSRTIERIRFEEELRIANDKLQVERKALQESNAALRSVLARIEEEKGAIKEAILANVEKIILPILHALEADVSPEKKGYVKLLRRNLEEITSPLVDRLSRKFLTLTPAELRTCNMIRMGLSTKEIARIRHVATATVNHQRESIRRKLGLTGRSANLITYLQTFNPSVSRMVQDRQFSLQDSAEPSAN